MPKFARNFLDLPQTFTLGEALQKPPGTLFKRRFTPHQNSNSTTDVFMVTHDRKLMVFHTTEDSTGLLDPGGACSYTFELLPTGSRLTIIQD